MYFGTQRYNNLIISFTLAPESQSNYVELRLIFNVTLGNGYLQNYIFNNEDNYGSYANFVVILKKLGFITNLQMFVVSSDKLATFSLPGNRQVYKTLFSRYQYNDKNINSRS